MLTSMNLNATVRVVPCFILFDFRRYFWFFVQRFGRPFRKYTQRGPKFTIRKERFRGSKCKREWRTNESASGASLSWRMHLKIDPVWVYLSDDWLQGCSLRTATVIVSLQFYDVRHCLPTGLSFTLPTINCQFLSNKRHDETHQQRVYPFSHWEYCIYGVRLQSLTTIQWR